MSISGALSSALSGLSATARAAEVVSSNIANARTEGYGRRELITTARAVGATGQGVQVVGVERRVNAAILSERRLAGAAANGSGISEAFFKRYEHQFGNADSASSVNGRIAEFDAALLAAASRPDAEARLAKVLQSAQGIVSQINGAAAELRQARTDADAAIASNVEKLNNSLQQVANLNTQIRGASGTGRDVSALIDQRQQVVDSIAAIIPIREVDRGLGQIALFSTGGAILLDGAPARIGFQAAGLVTEGMTVGGALSGLTLNGQPLAISGSYNAIAGGTLAANFAIRDELAPQAQIRLDAMARDLISRFADPAMDPTQTVGGAGLFTDDGAAFLPANELGLANRLQVNAAVDPAKGGALWRLRDGIGAASPGPTGNPALLVAMNNRLAEARPPASGGFMAGARSLAGLGSDIASGIASSRLKAEGDARFDAARHDALKTEELADGVDTDQEMQNLLLIEQAYSANARIIKTIDEMIQALLRI